MITIAIRSIDRMTTSENMNHIDNSNGIHEAEKKCPESPGRLRTALGASRRFRPGGRSVQVQRASLCLGGDGRTVKGESLKEACQR